MKKNEKDALKTAIEVFDRKCREYKKLGVTPLIYQKGKKEQFSEWFINGLKDLIVDTYGENEHPDYVLKHTVGFELKSFSGNIKVIQFNSTMPCGGFRHNQVEGECYYAIANYKREKGRDNGYLINFCICDGDFINNDREFAFSQTTETESDLGSYRDGEVRYRPFYNFPNPLRLVPGVSFISKYGNAVEMNNNLIQTDCIEKIDRKGVHHKFYIYRHKMWPLN